MADLSNVVRMLIHQLDATRSYLLPGYCDEDEKARAVIAFAESALAAEPPAPGPTIDDIWELCEDHEFHLGMDGANEEESAEGLLEIINTALGRWGRPAPAEPVATLHVSDFRGYENYDFQHLVDLPPGQYKLFTACTAQPPAPDPREALAARPLLEAVARLGDCIGQHTVGEITTISDRAAAWLRENPPGQPVAIEPRGCPTPGACSCVEAPAPADPSDFQTLQGIALDMVESLRPIVLPEILGVLRRAIKQPPAPAPAGHVPDAGNVVAADGEAEELATLLAIGSSCAAGAKLSPEQCRRAAALLSKSKITNQKARELAATVQAAYSAYGWVPEDQFNRLFDEVARVADVMEEGWDCSLQGPLDWQREIEKLKSQANPPSANGEAEELAQWLDGEAKSCAAQFHDRITRAAALLRQSAPAPAPEAGEAEELAQWLEFEADNAQELGCATIYDHDRLRWAAGYLRQLPPGGLEAIRYCVEEDGAVIQRTSRAPESWAIRAGSACMSTTGEWDIEPMPSDRTDEWLVNHRWPSAAAAWEALQQARGQEVGDE